MKCYIRIKVLEVILKTLTEPLMQQPKIGKYKKKVRYMHINFSRGVDVRWSYVSSDTKKFKAIIAWFGNFFQS